MMAQDCHAALKTEVISDLTRKGFHYKLVRLQNAKDAYTDTLHVIPTRYSTAGFQRTDFLSVVGFSRSRCAFHRGECYCRRVDPGLSVEAFAAAMETAFQSFVTATKELEGCGIFIDQPEGWNFFVPGAPIGKHFSTARHARGDGHTSPVSKHMKEAEDAFFRYVLTWIEGGSDKGWVIHYRPKEPTSVELDAALRFLPGFQIFENCPEFDFSECFWRFIPWEAEYEDSLTLRSAERAHGWFSAHEEHFSRGLELLLAAHAQLKPFGFTFLPIAKTTVPRSTSSTRPLRRPVPQDEELGKGEEFDVALSFAGTERVLAEALAEKVKASGYRVFYDRFYPEQLWGKDLVEFFDDIYRKRSRFCVIFLSKAYKDRMWTIQERRSAQARALEEKGREYILPIRVDSVDIPGLPPTLGYLSLQDFSIEQVAEILVRKIESATGGGPPQQEGDG